MIPSNLTGSHEDEGMPSDPLNTNTIHFIYRKDGNPSGDLPMESHEVQNFDCVVGSPDALSFPYHLHRLLRTLSQRIPIILQ